MFTLLLRLKAPLQSWGDHSRFIDRDTGREPTKSGVIGLVCASVGIPRDGDLSALSKLKFGIRVNKEGRIRTDFHTAGKGGFMRASGSKEETNLIVTHRHFLSDADFLAGLEAEDDSLLKKIEYALRHPKWDLYLGRKSFVPSLPVFIKDGLVQKPLIEALTNYPLTFEKTFLWNEDYDKDNKTMKLRFAVEGEIDDKDIKVVMSRRINDQPISFAARNFLPRTVSIFYKDVPVSGMPAVKEKEADDVHK